MQMCILSETSGNSESRMNVFRWKHVFCRIDNDAFNMVERNICDGSHHIYFSRFFIIFDDTI